MNPADIVLPFLAEFDLPQSLALLIFHLLEYEIATGHPSLGGIDERKGELAKRYAKGLLYIFNRLPTIYELDDAKLYATIGTLIGVTEQDSRYLWQLRTNIEAKRHYEFARQYKERLNELERELSFSEDKTFWRQQIRDMKETIKQHDKDDEDCYVPFIPKFFQDLLNFNVSFDLPSRNEHAMVVGKTGSGKTSLLQQLIYEDIQTDAAVIVMTIKGAMIPTLSKLTCIPNERLVLINPQHPIALNLFDLEDEDESTIELISSIFSDADAKVTNKQSTPLHHLIKLLLQYRDSSGQRATIRTLRNLLIAKTLPSEFQPYVAQLSQSGQDFFRDSFHRAEFTPSKEQLFWRMEGLLKNSFTEHMFCQSESAISFQEIMRQGKVLLILADEGKLGNEGAQFLLRLMLALVTIAAKNRKDKGERPCYVYCDEIGAYITPNVATILKRCREKNVGLNLAFQELEDLGTLESTIRTNTSAKFVGKCEEADAKKMAGTMLLEPQTLFTQGKLHFYLKMDDFKHSIPIKVPPGGFAKPPATTHREHATLPQSIPTPPSTTDREKEDRYDESAW